ncbi:dTMP kinase [Variovorax sp. LjRoot178]|uniref:dTMP kinase n=1 Tax=Variovorax sp. LjRoot178 TaxID=3342277 RepID=UPI003F51918A
MSGERGLFLSLEGVDGAGKSGHIGAVAKFFEAAGRTVVVTREPGGTPLAEQLRTMILNESMDPLTEALLCFAARRDHIHTKIAPALAAGNVVICDRFADSTFAYQGGGRGFDLATLSALEAMVQDRDMLAAAGRTPGPDAGGALLKPDLTLFFYLDPAIAAERLAGARAPDKFERQPIDFFHSVNNGYMARVRSDPMRFVLINASLPREQVWADVQANLVARTPDEQGPGLESDLPGSASSTKAVISAYAIDLPPRDSVRIERAGQISGPAKWAVRLNGECLNRTGEWEWEPMPSGRDDAFLARCRFDTDQEAIDAAARAVAAMVETVPIDPPHLAPEQEPSR